MAGLGKLSPEDLAGAVEVPAPAAAVPVTSLGKLSDEEINGPTPEDPSILGTLGRSAIGGATLGFDDEIVGALKSAFTDKTYKAARDEYRATRKLDADVHPIVNTVGELGGSLAPALLTGGGSEAVTAAEAAPTIGKLALQGAKMGAAYGAGQGLGDSTADLTDGNWKQALADTVKGGVVGGIGGAILEPVAGKLFGGAGQREKEDIVRGIVAGDGTHGKATATASKLIAKREGSIVGTVLADPELREAVGKDAAEALPVVRTKMQEVGSQLKPLDDKLDEVAGGGISIGQVVRHAMKDVDVDQIRGSAGSETKVKAIKDWLTSLVNAMGPKDAEGNSIRMGDALFTEKGRLNPHVVDALDDVRTPTNAYRAEVTRLQDRGIAVLDSLSNRAESTNIKQEIAQEAKQALDNHMDAAAHLNPELEPVVTKRRELNSVYSDLATMARAIDERGWKEKSQGISGQGLVNKLLHGGGMLGAGAMVAHGNLPGAAMALAGPKLLEQVHKLGPVANRALAQLAENAASGRVTAKLADKALREGVPLALVLEVVRKAGGHQANAGNSQAAQ